MFDKDVLQELIGYERWVLEDLVIVVKDCVGLVPEGNFAYNGERPLAILIEGNVVMGGQKQREVVENLSPLIFVTSYKVIDMIFEWIFRENEREVKRWTFTYKVEKLKGVFEKSYSNIPPVLDGNKDLLLTFFALYTELLPYRHAFIHKVWGTNQQGNLAFSFVDKGITYNLDMSFQEVINLAELVTLLLHVLLTETYDRPLILSKLKSMMNGLQHLHKQHVFHHQPPHYYRVDYDMKQFPENRINLKKIREELVKQACGEGVTFSLRVLSEDKQWEFPWHFIQGEDELELTSVSNKYLV